MSVNALSDLPPSPRSDWVGGACIGATAVGVGVAVAQGESDAIGLWALAVIAGAGLVGGWSAWRGARQRRRAAALAAAVAEEQRLLAARLSEVEGWWRDAQRVAEATRSEGDQRRALEQRVLALQSQYCLGRMAGGAAHAFNNLLVGIMGYASAAEELGDVSEAELRQFLAQINTASHRAALLCYQLMVAAGRRTANTRELFPHRFRAEVAPLLEACVGRSAVLKIELEPHLPRVHADLPGLQVALTNLVFNALDATGLQPAVLTLAVRRVAIDETRLTPGGTLAVGEYVVFALQDAGAGLAPEAGARIFEPFFTTRTGRLGLGLSAVAQWTESLAGGLVVRPHPAGGTVAELFLPVVLVPSEGASGVSDAAGPAVRGTKPWRVLFVDDDETVRQLAAMLLGQMGADVTLAEDGPTALRLFAAGRPFDLAMVDYSMPGMDGVETLQRLRELEPDLRAVVVSGALRSEIDDLASLGELAGFLQKPFNYGAVRTLISELGF